MKNLFRIGMVALIATLSTYSCQKETEQTESEKLVAQQCLQSTKGGNSASLSTTPYNVYLYEIKNNFDGTYTWEWRVRNLNPGNGNSGTVQNLSHWGITLGDCIKPENIVAAATSTNGTTWTPFTPEYKKDPSQDCFTEKVIKFELGTTGTNISYYRLTVNKNVSHTSRTGLYKSGNKTGCGTLETCGFGCE
jgi:hypothetical protein